MSDAQEALENAEHAAHARGGHGKPSGLGTYIGLTMGLLGVLLAFAAAKVGGERTELVETLVDQQTAESKYQSQDVKHRMAFIALAQVHATMPSAADFAAGTKGPAKKDVVELARTVSRYFKEATLAKEWVEAFEPAIKAHVDAQEDYELAQLLAEIGIVLASIGLLLQRKVAWFLSLGLGVGAISVIAATYVHTHRDVTEAEETITARAKTYRDARNADKTTASEDAMLAEMMTWGGAQPEPAEVEHEEVREARKHE